MVISRALALGMLISVAAGTTALADPIGQATSYDAFINLGTTPYAGAGLIASGDPQPWYDSPQVARLFGGVPNAQQQQDFDQAVMQDVQQTFQSSGIPVSLTDSPTDSAFHTLSLVSNASSAAFPGAIGTTDLGSNGLSFIDPMAAVAQSVNQLEWLVAHNISHELMLSFGVGENYDQTGSYIDARNANFAMMINPDSTFSAAAAQAIRSHLSNVGFQQVLQPGAQSIAPTPAPEPATVALWGLMAASVIVANRARRRR